MDAQRLVALFFEAGTLRKIQRSHQQTFLTSDPSDNIAAHTFRVCLIGMVLAHLVKDARPERVLTMCLLHDLLETRTGDQNWIHKSYVSVDEGSIRAEQFAPLAIIAPSIISMIEEYDARESLDAKVAKDADNLEQFLLLAEYRHAGNKEAERWLSDRERKRARLFTEEAQLLFDELCVQSPSDWWQTLHRGVRLQAVKG